MDTTNINIVIIGGFLFLLAILIGGGYYLIRSLEGLSISIPPPQIQYPANLPVAPGNAGWGYRDPVATHATLLWQQDQPMIFVPGVAPPQPPIPIGSMSRDSAPVPVKTNNFCETIRNRPPAVKVRQRPVATAPYASW